MWAVVAPDGGLWFMTPEAGFCAETVSFNKSRQVSPFAESIIFSAPLTSCSSVADFTVYGLLVAPDASPANRDLWLSNLAEVQFRVTALPDNLLAEINDEPYLFPASSAVSSELSGLSLRRWDFVFLGEKVDDPATFADESNLNRLIPGNYRHVLLYLGRDKPGSTQRA